MRTLASIFLMIATVLLFTRGQLWAQPPDIDIELRFDKEALYFESGEPIGVNVVVRNQSRDEIWISEGFSSKVYYRQLQIIDPSGQLLLARLSAPSSATTDASSLDKTDDGSPLPEEFEVEAPDAPAFPWTVVEDRAVRKGFCERLPAGWTSAPEQERADDLREYYDIALPGYYSAQVKVAVMVFKGLSCSLYDYQYQGELKSETVYFYVAGRTQVDVVPKRWKLSWLKEDDDDDEYDEDEYDDYEYDDDEGLVRVRIWPPEGMDIANYNRRSIRLNNVEAIYVLKRYARLKKKYYLLALFNKKKAIKSLGEVQVGQWYPAALSGKFNNGEFFGGAQKIKIVR